MTESSEALADAVGRYVARHDAVVGSVVAEAASRVPAFAERLAAAGLAAEDVRGAAGLDALPVLSKDDLIAGQRERPPFGGLLAADEPVRRVFCSPGPLYEPQLSGVDSWRWGAALRAAGFGPGDVVLNCFGYHLSPAGAMLEDGALSLGCTVLPGGVGAMDLQARAVADFGVTGYIGLPSYLKALIEQFGEHGDPAAGWPVRRALVTAEPLPDSLRGWLHGHVQVVRSAYGTADVGLIGHEVAGGAGLRLAGGVFVQVCDLTTGAPVTSGEGQVVVTLLRPEYPLVRFGTGDLSAWTLGPDGELRLAGVLGRAGEAVKVRGMFLHPRQAAATVGTVPGVAGYRFVVDRVAHRDLLRCEVVPAGGADQSGLPDTVRASVRAALRFDADVVLVDSLPAGAPVIDDRRDWS